MGIGRASGEERASQAAQQAIESPLIEVSIDGAKGVLFNVTGGYDMTMAEIQEAAEIITSAVSPDANIIFGATLKPEMEDELVITVIATGFDSEYFHEQAATMSTPTGSHDTASAVKDEDIAGVNMDIDSKPDASEEFASESGPNLWNEPTQSDDEDDTPAFLRRRKKNKEQND
jgi:cell division protein FtsZ